jgi:D-lactate dehydrogenase
MTEEIFSTTTPAYDIIHFEVLGAEKENLKEETLKAISRGALPENHRFLITEETLQAFLEKHPEVILPPIITTKNHSFLPDNYFEGGKKSVITRSAGYDHFEDFAGKMNVTSLREYCVNAVAQTAIRFLYITTGKLNHYTANAATFNRGGCEAFLELSKELVLTVFGVGRIGKRIYELAVANGLTVQGVDLRQEELTKIYGDSVRFVSKERAFATSNIIINAMNLNRKRESTFYNMGYFSPENLGKAPKGLTFINVTRGEMAPEAGLLGLHRNGQLSGIAIDVYSDEADFDRFLSEGWETTDENLLAARTLVRMALDRTANIYVQPHQGFNSHIAAQTKATETVKHVIAWYKNGGRCFDEQLPYY